MIHFFTRRLEQAQQSGPRLARRARRVTAWGLLCLLGLGGFAAPVWAQLPPNMTVGERAMLPPYCADTQGFGIYGDASYNTSPRAGHWISLMGKTFWHMHHHCYALVRMHRAQFAETPQARKGHLNGAVGDFLYVVNNGTADFVLLPEVLLKTGDAYVQLGDFGKAMDAYTAARTKKPDYWPAYTHWAKALADAGLKAKAMAALEDGLRVMPNEPNLIKAYAKLGGNAESAAKRRPAAPVAAPVVTSSQAASVVAASPAAVVVSAPTAPEPMPQSPTPQPQPQPEKADVTKEVTQPK
jgi:tetratricopeptide (TPR) repeat protein